MCPSAFLRRSFIYTTHRHTQKVSSICDDYRTTTQQPPPPPGLCFSFSQTAKFFPTNRVEFFFFFYFFPVGTLGVYSLRVEVYTIGFIYRLPHSFLWGFTRNFFFFSMDIPLEASPSNHQSHQKLIDSYYRFLDQFTFLTNNLLTKDL